ncbi:MAG: hypothetical protein SWX82_24305 [Cyanobacteriota bacterium]|nr:hypothetical protein [Cyanobacteriota bacterium]
MSNQPSEKPSQSNKNQELSNQYSNSSRDKKRSAPEFPPATEKSQRTNSVNLGENTSDQNWKEITRKIDGEDESI